MCRFRVLDECDEMLNMGFVDDVELILTAGGSTEVQTLLFSATLPSWVKDITRRFLRSDHRTIDLVGNEKVKVGDSSAMQQVLGSRAVLSVGTEAGRLSKNALTAGAHSCHLTLPCFHLPPHAGGVRTK